MRGSQLWVPLFYALSTQTSLSMDPSSCTAVPLQVQEIWARAIWSLFLTIITFIGSSWALANVSFCNSGRCFDREIVAELDINAGVCIARSARTLCTSCMWSETTCFHVKVRVRSAWDFRMLCINVLLVLFSCLHFCSTGAPFLISSNFGFRCQKRSWAGITLLGRCAKGNVHCHCHVPPRCAVRTLCLPCVCAETQCIPEFPVSSQ